MRKPWETEAALARMEELVNLARTAKESADQAAQERVTYLEDFVQNVILLDEFLSRKEMADLFQITQNSLNVTVFRYKNRQEKG